MRVDVCGGNVGGDTPHTHTHGSIMGGVMCYEYMWRMCHRHNSTMYYGCRNVIVKILNASEFSNGSHIGRTDMYILTGGGRFTTTKK